MENTGSNLESFSQKVRDTYRSLYGSEMPQGAKYESYINTAHSELNVDTPGTRVTIAATINEALREVRLQKQMVVITVNRTSGSVTKEFFQTEINEMTALINEHRAHAN